MLCLKKFCPSFEFVFAEKSYGFACIIICISLLKIEIIFIYFIDLCLFPLFFKIIYSLLFFFFGNKIQDLLKMNFVFQIINRQKSSSGKNWRLGFFKRNCWFDSFRLARLFLFFTNTQVKSRTNISFINLTFVIFKAVHRQQIVLL